MVRGYRNTTGTWILKQSDDTVVSTKDSLFEIEGSVDGGKFKGKLKGGRSTFFIKLQISSDGQSFKGTITGQDISVRAIIVGRRQK